MKKIYIILFLFFWCAYCGKAQYTGTNIQLPQQYQGSGTYTATGNINVSPTFNHNANPDGPINLQIKDPLSFEVPTSGTTGGPNTGNGYVGSIDGGFTVTPAGSASYTIPIFTPPGISGLAPEIALVYSSMAGEGNLGKGWDISGISAITRTASSYHYGMDSEPKPGPIDFAGDVLLLDGKHLILENEVKESELKFTNTYKTEYDEFSRIVYESDQDRFIEYTKSGLIKTYGGTESSRWTLQETGGNATPLIWYINEIKDRNGNLIKFNYFFDVTTGQMVIRSIDYTLTPINNFQFNRIEFKYNEIVNPNRQREFLYNKNSVKFAKFSKYLDRIEIKNIDGGNEILIKKYQLTYTENSIDKANYLTKITEYNGQGQALEPIVFEYSSPAVPKYDNNPVTTWINSNQKKYLLADLDNDNKTDVITKFGSSTDWVSSRDGVRRIIYNNGYVVPVNCYNIYNPDGDEIIDVLGDNIDILKPKVDGSTEILKSITLSECVHDKVYPGDFNGDGLTDLLLDPCNDKIYKIAYGLPNGFDGNLKNTDIPVSTQIYLADFDGDGTTDILYITGVAASIRYFTTTYGFNLPYATDQIFTGDYNGDGKTDICCVTLPNGNTNLLAMYFSAGAGNFKRQNVNTPSNLNFLSTNGHLSVEIGDFNSDGRSDFAVEIWDRIYIYSTSQSGTTFELISNTIVGNPALEEVDLIGIGDYRGIGYPDLYFKNKDIKFENERIQALTVYNNNYPPMADDVNCKGLLTKVTNCLGQQTLIQYETLTKGESYSATNFKYHYPLVPFSAPLNVVKEVKISDDQNNFFPPTKYNYTNAIVHLRGKGFLGFEKFIVTDERTNIVSEQVFAVDTNNQYFFKPVSSSSYVLIDDMKYYIKQDFFEYRFKKTTVSPINGFKVLFPYIYQQIEKEFELDGSLKTVTKTISEYDDYFGNLLSVEISKGLNTSNMPFKTIVTHTYDNYVSYSVSELSKWILGRLKSAKVTIKAPGQQDIFKESAFDYYEEGTNWFGMLKSEAIVNADASKTIKKVYEYDRYGNILKSTATAGSEVPRINTTVYDNIGRFTDYSLNAKGHKTDYYYEPIYGNLLTATDPNNLTTSYEYDGFGNLYKIIYPDGNYSITAMRWASGHELAPANAVYYIWKQTTGSQPSLEFFDCMQRPLRQVTYGFKGEIIFVDFIYDAAGRLEKQSEPYLRRATPQYIVYTYDRFQRVKTTTHPGNRVTTYYYEGLTQKIKNPKNQYSTKKFNAAGWLMESYDNANEKITYDYYADGLLKDMYDPNRNKTSIFYDDFRRKNKVIDPDLGTIEYGYNAFGELIWQKENGTVTLQSVLYDVLGRVTEKIETESTIRYTYDTRPNGIGMLATYTYSYRDANGNSLTESRMYSYDALGRLITDAKTIDGTNYNFNYTYNQYNQPLTVTYPTGYELRNEYNAFGNLDRIFDNRNNKIWDAVNVDEKGKIKEIVTGNVVRTTFEFNPVTGYLTAIKSNKVGQNNNALQNFVYQWDAIGNLTMRKDANRNLQEDFTYDGLNRLRTVKLNGVLKQETRYDKLGNITYKSDVGSYNYEGPKPHAVTSINGSTVLINRLNQNVSYTSFNKVCAISEENRESELSASMIILYGADHQRIKQVITDFEGNTTLRWHITPNFEKEIKNGRTKYIHYVSSPTGTVAHFIMDSEMGESINYILKDHLGSVQSVVDKNGNLLEEYSYDAWGLRRNPNTLEPLVNLNAYLTGRGFTGHEHIDLFALVNMNGRIYDPVIGRFMSADPYIQFPDYTQSLNRYSYCLNNPLSFTDPTGYKTFMGKLLRAVAPVVINIVVSAVLSPVMGPGAAIFAGFISNFAGTLINGGNLGDALINGIQSGVISGLTACLAFTVGDIGLAIRDCKGIVKELGMAVLHGTSQGAMRAMQGGRFEHGFISGAVGSLVGSATNNWSGAARIFTAAALAGTAEKMAGGISICFFSIEKNYKCFIPHNKKNR